MAYQNRSDLDQVVESYIADSDIVTDKKLTEDQKEALRDFVLYLKHLD